MASKKSDYLGLSYIVSVILAIFPPIALILGFITRLTEGKIVAALIRILCGWNIIWIADLVSMILFHKIVRILNI